MSSQWGQARGLVIPSGSNTFTYRSVTNDSQFWQVGIPARGSTSRKRVAIVVDRGTAAGPSAGPAAMSTRSRGTVTDTVPIRPSGVVGV